MKRIHIALILLIITALICSTQLIFVYTICNYFIDKLENTENFFKKGEYEKAQDLSTEIAKEWKRTSKIADMFLFHDYIDNITSNINKIEIFIEEQDSVNFYTICSDLKNQISSLKNSEIPTAENII